MKHSFEMNYAQCLFLTFGDLFDCYDQFDQYKVPSHDDKWMSSRRHHALLNYCKGYSDHHVFSCVHSICNKSIYRRKSYQEGNSCPQIYIFILVMSKGNISHGDTCLGDQEKTGHFPTKRSTVNIFFKYSLQLVQDRLMVQHIS